MCYCCRCWECNLHNPLHMRNGTREKKQIMGWWKGQEYTGCFSEEIQIVLLLRSYRKQWRLRRWSFVFESTMFVMGYIIYTVACRFLSAYTFVWFRKTFPLDPKTPKQPPRAQPQPVDGGCCGFRGSFLVTSKLDWWHLKRLRLIIQDRKHT